HTAASNRNFQTYAAGSQQAVGTQGARHAQGSGFTVPAGTTQSTNAGGYVCRSPSRTSRAAAWASRTATPGR
ncbi:hypothetical protein, partial [Pseudoclavibacter helvolus]|uniref:hypothetical protein n=1 Tax=Pseudoclavibacter helvolus TaxID=255205 RepID=UPI000AB571D0